MLPTNKLLGMSHSISSSSSSKFSQEVLSSSHQDKLESFQSDTSYLYKKFTFVLFIDEYTSENIASSLTFQVCDQYGQDLAEGSEIEKEKSVSSDEGCRQLSSIDLYERRIHIQYKFQATDCHHRIEDLFIQIRIAPTNVSKVSFFASCAVFENDYRHSPVFLHLQTPCLPNCESPPLVIGIFRTIIDGSLDHLGSWVYKNESFLFQAFENCTESPDNDRQMNPTTDECYSDCQQDTLDCYKALHDKLAQVRKRIIGKSKRTVFYSISKQDLIDFFLLPRDEVAHELGICVTLLKKICRKNGIKQWPYRKLKNLDARLSSLRLLLSTSSDSVCTDRKKFHEEYHMLLNEKEKILHGNE